MEVHVKTHLLSVFNVLFWWLDSCGTVMAHPAHIFRNLDNVVGNLARNFAEGTEYFKVSKCYLLFDSFSLPIKYVIFCSYCIFRKTHLYQDVWNHFYVTDAGWRLCPRIQKSQKHAPEELLCNSSSTGKRVNTKGNNSF